MKTANSLQEIYHCLFHHFGKQGWWPLLNEQLENQYHVGAPRNEDEQFEICVGAILTQNTQWEPNVVRALQALHQHHLLNRKALQTVSLEKLAPFIRSAGYFNQKAKKLQIFANYDGPITRDALLTLWGLGPETVDSILLYAHNQPFFVIDAYTKRIVERLGFGEHTYATLQHLCMEHLPRDVELYKEFHALFVALGKEHCTKKNPSCHQCPLQEMCTYGKKATSH